MISKKLTGYLLTIAPILMMGVWMGLWPSPDGANPTYVEEIAAIQADDLAPYVMLLGMGSWITMLIALVFLNRSMNTGGSVASDLAGLGAIVALLAAAASVANMGVGLVATDTDFRGSQELIAAVNDAGSYAFPVLLGATGIFTGLAIYLSKSLNTIIGIISIILGLVIVGGAVIPYPELADDFYLDDVAFMLLTLTVVIMGVLTLRSKDQA